MNAKYSYYRQERIPFATGSYSYTHCFALYVIDLIKTMSHKDAFGLLDMSWDTIKDIHLRYHERHYSPPSLAGVDYIGINEFAVKKVQDHILRHADRQDSLCR